MRIRPAKLAVTTLLLTSLAIGAGETSSFASPANESGKTAKTILADSKKALAAAHTVHLTGVFRDGNVKESLSITLVAGVGASAHIVLGKKIVDLISLGKYDYLRGNAAAFGSKAAVVKGRWVRVSSTSAAGKEFTTAFNLFSIKAISRDLTDTSLSPAVKTATFHGTPVVVLTDTKDSSELLVSNTGAPLPLDATGPHGSSTNSLRFSGYNAHVSLHAPASFITVPGL